MQPSCNEKGSFAFYNTKYTIKDKKSSLSTYSTSILTLGKVVQFQIHS